MAASVFRDFLNDKISINQNITKRTIGHKTLHVNHEPHYVEIFLTRDAREFCYLSYYFTYNWIDNKGYRGSRFHPDDSYDLVPFPRKMISREQLLNDILWPFKLLD